MDYKDFSLILATVVFVMYVSYVWGRFGVQKSISISYYDFPNENRWIFRTFIWILSIAIIIAGIGWKTPWFFISGGLLSLVGFFSRIKVKRKYIVHMIGAISGIVAGFIGVFVQNIELGICVFAAIFGQSMFFLIHKSKNIIWNIEIACFTWIMLALLYMNY